MNENNINNSENKETAIQNEQQPVYLETDDIIAKVLKVLLSERTSLSSGKQILIAAMEELEHMPITYKKRYI